MYKKRDSRADLLFFSVNTLLFWCSRCRHRRVFVPVLTVNNTFIEFSESEVDPSSSILSLFFRDYPKSPSHLKRRELRLEMKRGDLARVQTEMIEFIGLLFPFSSKLKIWSFHVVGMQGRQRNVQKAWFTCRLVVFLSKYIAFLMFPLPSPSCFCTCTNGKQYFYRIFWIRSWSKL